MVLQPDYAAPTTSASLVPACRPWVFATVTGPPWIVVAAFMHTNWMDWLSLVLFVLIVIASVVAKRRFRSGGVPGAWTRFDQLFIVGTIALALIVPASWMIENKAISPTVNGWQELTACVCFTISTPRLINFYDGLAKVCGTMGRSDLAKFARVLGPLKFLDEFVLFAATFVHFLSEKMPKGLIPGVAETVIGWCIAGSVLGYVLAWFPTMVLHIDFEQAVKMQDRQGRFESESVHESQESF